MSPVWYLQKPNGTYGTPQPDLFRLVAAANVIILKKPKAAKSEPVPATACVSYPYALMFGRNKLVHIKKEGNSFFC